MFDSPRLNAQSVTGFMGTGVAAGKFGGNGKAAIAPAGRPSHTCAAWRAGAAMSKTKKPAPDAPAPDVTDSDKPEDSQPAETPMGVPQEVAKPLER